MSLDSWPCQMIIRGTWFCVIKKLEKRKTKTKNKNPNTKLLPVLNARKTNDSTLLCKMQRNFRPHNEKANNKKFQQMYLFLKFALSKESMWRYEKLHKLAK